LNTIVFLAILILRPSGNTTGLVLLVEITTGSRGSKGSIGMIGLPSMVILVFAVLPSRGTTVVTF